MGHSGLSGQPNNKFNQRIAEAVVLVFLILVYAFRLYLIPRLPFNPDELFTLGCSWNMAHGLQPYFDFMVPHPAFFFVLLKPLVDSNLATADMILIGRLFSWLNMALFAVVLHLFLRKHLAPILSFLTIAYLNTFSFFLERTVHLRQDTPALFLNVLAILLVIVGKRRNATFVLGGFVGGLACTFHLLAIPIVAGIALWLLIFSEPAEWKIRVRHFLGFSLTAALTFLAQYPLLFGGATMEAVKTQLDMLSLTKLYLANVQTDSWQIFYHVAGTMAFLWIPPVAGWLWAHWRLLVSRQTVPAWQKLLLILIDVNLLWIVLHEPNFEQHYLYLAVFGSILGSLWMFPKIKSEKISYIGSTIIIVFFIVILGHYYYHFNVSPAELRRSSSVEWSSSSLSTQDVREYLHDNEKILMDPFNARANKQRRAQMDFLVAHSTPQDSVFTDWLNPPLRRLPVPENHGNMISAYYRSTQLPKNEELTALVKHLDPTYQPADPDQATRFIRLFSARTPAVILLEGTLAKLYCEADSFTHWLDEHYKMRMEPVSGSIFALRREASTSSD